MTSTRTSWVVVGLFAVACGDDGPSGDTGATAPSTGSADEGDTGATSAGSAGTDGSGSGDADSSSTGEPQILPMCGGANDQPMCESTYGCVWDHTPGQCVVDCNIILEQAVCLHHDDCAWDGQACSGMPH